MSGCSDTHGAIARFNSCAGQVREVQDIYNLMAILDLERRAILSFLYKFLSLRCVMPLKLSFNDILTKEYKDLLLT